MIAGQFSVKSLPRMLQERIKFIAWIRTETVYRAYNRHLKGIFGSNKGLEKSSSSSSSQSSSSSASNQAAGVVVVLLLLSASAQLTQVALILSSRALQSCVKPT